MIHSLVPVDVTHASRADVARALRGPRLEWDSLSGMMIPAYLGGDREPRELLRGDVMLSGPWSWRGDNHEQRLADAHERTRLRVYAALGYLNRADRPAFEAPGYERNREVARYEMLGTGSEVDAAFTFGAPPLAQIWQFTTAKRYYDARYLYTETSGKVTTLQNGGADGSTYDATNASSTLTRTAGFSGVLDALTGTAGAQDYLPCGGTAANSRFHGGNTWTIVTCGRFADTSATRTIWSNRNSSGTAPLGCGLYHITGTGMRHREGNGATTVYSAGAATVDPGTSAFVTFYRFSATLVSGRGSRTSLNTFATTGTVSQTNAPSNTDASILALCGGSAGNTPNNGALAILTLHDIDSSGFAVSQMDHIRALGRI